MTTHPVTKGQFSLTVHLPDELLAKAADALEDLATLLEQHPGRPLPAAAAEAWRSDHVATFDALAREEALRWIGNPEARPS